MPYARNRSLSRRKSSSRRAVSFTRTKSTKTTKSRASGYVRKRRYSRAGSVRTEGLGSHPVNVQRGSRPLTEQGLNHFPYSVSYAATASGLSDASVVPYVWNCTGPYDPQVSAGGGQPIQWDQVAPFYTRYQVYAVRCEVWFSNPTDDRAWVGFRVSPDTDPITTAGRSIAQLKQMQNTKIAPLSNSGEQRRYFKCYFKPKAIFGASTAQYGGSQFSSFTNDVPDTNIYFEPFVICQNDSDTDDVTVHVTVRITYYVKFYGKITVFDA